MHAVRFAVQHSLTAHAIKGLSPAASFFHSVIAIWPDRDRGFRIWGILNTGPRWMNQVAGGRKPVGEKLPFPMIHVRDPGWMLFYHAQNLIAEWRGREFHGPRMDVFQSQLLRDRFAGHRLGLIENLINCCLPPSLSVDDYAELSHLISLQFVKRVINLVRTSGHGGSLVFLPDDAEGMETATRWIDCKYSATPDSAGPRFRVLLESMIRRVGELAPENSTAEDAWSVFRNSSDPELDRLEESFFELARLFADLMQVDGARGARQEPATHRLRRGNPGGPDGAAGGSRPGSGRPRDQALGRAERRHPPPFGLSVMLGRAGDDRIRHLTGQPCEDDRECGRLGGVLAAHDDLDGIATSEPSRSIFLW